MKTKMFHNMLLVTILCLAALLLVFGSWKAYTSTFDTATVGLMSVNILGGERPLFFYGQPYFGALEAYVSAIFLYLFGFSEFVVSLSPISFTLAWILFTYLLFTRIHNRTAGVVAAISVAFPGYYVFWYSVATYGGYPVVLCLGTAILWLSLRMLQERPRGMALVFQSVWLGIFMGLGVWVHALIYPYIAIALILLVWFVVKERFRFTLIVSLGLTGMIALLGFLPFYLETGSFLGGMSESVTISLRSIVAALNNLFAANIYELVVWNFRQVFESSILQSGIGYGSILMLFLAVLSALFSLVTFRGNRLKKTYYIIPLLFCLLFMTMFTQHHMATIRAPRYAIIFWSMILCMVWCRAIACQRKTIFVIFSSILFSLWITYQVAGTLFFVNGKSAATRIEQQKMRDIVHAAREKNLDSVITYGDASLGYKAQKLSMYSQNRIVFANSGVERYSSNAQFTETSRNRGYLTKAEYNLPLQESLKALGLSFDVDKIHGYFLLSNLQQKERYALKAVPKKEITAGSKGFFLFDTGKQRRLCRIWIFPFQDPSSLSWKAFGQYEVYVSSDGTQFDKIYTSIAQPANAYHSGSQVFFGGPWGKIEISFAPVSARYVKIVFLEKSLPLVSDICIFQPEDRLRKNAPGDIVQLQKIILEQGLDFVFADRWVSGNLRKLFKGTDREGIALPRHSTRYKNDPLRYFLRPRKGQAVVCDRAVSDECESTLVKQFGEPVITKRLDLENYSLFILGDIRDDIIIKYHSALLWNGHLLTRLTDMTILAPWLNTQGVPVWRADFSKTKGVFSDSWTNGEGKFYNLGYTIQREKDQELVIYTHGCLPDSEMSTLNLQVVANENVALTFKGKKQNEYSFYLPESLTLLDSLQINSTTFIPSLKDSRELGLDIKRIEIQ